MKRLLVISSSKSLLCYLCIFCIVGPVFAVQPTTNEVGDPDTDVYRKAREQEEKMATQYVSDSMK